MKGDGQVEIVLIYVRYMMNDSFLLENLRCFVFQSDLMVNKRPPTVHKGLKALKTVVTEIAVAWTSWQS